jgi:hypothetical protein
VRSSPTLDGGAWSRTERGEWRRYKQQSTNNNQSSFDNAKSNQLTKRCQNQDQEAQSVIRIRRDASSITSCNLQLRSVGAPRALVYACVLL